jgi:hypothetical protein
MNVGVPGWAALPPVSGWRRTELPGAEGRSAGFETLTFRRERNRLALLMSNPVFLTKSRKKWMARTFQGLFLLAAAGAAGESFLRLSFAWRLVVVGVGFGAFTAGLIFAKADTPGNEEA